MLARRSAGFVVVVAALLMSIASGTTTPSGYYSAVRDPTTDIGEGAPHYVEIVTENKRALSAGEKRLRYWVIGELRERGIVVVDDIAKARFIVFPEESVDSKEMEVTKTRPHSGFQYDSASNSWQSVTINESYEDTETYTVRRVTVTVYDLGTRESVWEGYLGVDDENYRRCPEAWVRDLVSVYPGDFDGRAALDRPCR